MGARQRRRSACICTIVARCFPRCATVLAPPEVVHSRTDLFDPRRQLCASEPKIAPDAQSAGCKGVLGRFGSSQRRQDGEFCLCDDGSARGDGVFARGRPPAKTAPLRRPRANTPSPRSLAAFAAVVAAIAAGVLGVPWSCTVDSLLQPLGMSYALKKLQSEFEEDEAIAALAGDADDADDGGMQALKAELKAVEAAKAHLSSVRRASEQKLEAGQAELRGAGLRGVLDASMLPTTATAAAVPTPTPAPDAALLSAHGLIDASALLKRASEAAAAYAQYGAQTLGYPAQPADTHACWPRIEAGCQRGRRGAFPRRRTGHGRRSSRRSCRGFAALRACPSGARTLDWRDHPSPATDAAPHRDRRARRALWQRRAVVAAVQAARIARPNVSGRSRASRGLS